MTPHMGYIAAARARAQVCAGDPEIGEKARRQFEEIANILWNFEQIQMFGFDVAKAMGVLRD